MGIGRSTQSKKVRREFSRQTIAAKIGLVEQGSNSQKSSSIHQWNVISSYRFMICVESIQSLISSYVWEFSTFTRSFLRIGTNKAQVSSQLNYHSRGRCFLWVDRKSGAVCCIVQSGCPSGSEVCP